MHDENPQNVPALTVLYPYGVDTGSLVTTSSAAVAREAGVIGETIDVSLVGGITSGSDLPSTHYLKKNDLFFPYTVFVDGEATGGGATSVIKSVQRGYGFINSGTLNVTITAVNPAKSFFFATGSAGYNNTQGNTCYIQNVVATGFTIKAYAANQGGYASWEVIEYV
jgi:hypothetical protein